MALVVKNPPANAGDVGDSSVIRGSGRAPEEGHGNPLQYTCPENPMERGASRARIHGVTKGCTPLKRLSMNTKACGLLLLFFLSNSRVFLVILLVSSCVCLRMDIS